MNIYKLNESDLYKRNTDKDKMIVTEALARLLSLNLIITKLIFSNYSISKSNYQDQDSPHWKLHCVV